MRLPDTRPKREIENLLPLVNVVFLLLIFFMVAGAFTSADPFLIQPTLANNESPADIKKFTILVSNRGELAVDNKIISVDELIPLVNESLQNQAVKKIQLKPDAQANALRLVEIIDLLSKSEAEAVHILTNRP